jgi:imidazolonepropionase
MSQVTLVRGARQLVTLAGPAGPRRGAAMNEVAVIPDGALLIVDGRINQVGPTRRVERVAEARDAELIDVTGHVVIPAFVDCYTRLLCGPPRSHNPEEDSVTAAVQAVRSHSAQRMELEGRKRLRQFVRCGTTALLAGCGYGLDESTELKALRVLKTLDDRPVSVIPSFFGAARCPVEFDGRPAAYLDWVTAEVLPLIAQRKLCQFVEVSDGFPRESVERFVQAAREHRFHVQIAAEGGVGFRPDSSVTVRVHGAADPAVAAAAMVTILLPGRDFQCGAREFGPARAMLQANAALALATGYDHLESATTSLPMILSLACTQMGLTPAEALTAVTVNAAAALGLSDELGNLEAGKRADFLIMGCADYRDIPLYFGMNLVAGVFHHGQQIYPMVDIN